MFLIAGLGNPGQSYAKNRHNVGFMAVDELVERFNIPASGGKFHAETYKGRIESHDVVVIKPQTFMNKSGVSVGEASRFYKIPLEHIMVIYDELDLAPGKVRVKKGGGSGGHNGIRDIDRAIGQDYWRMRVGIGHPGHKDRVTGYVLSDFSKEEMDIQRQAISLLARHFTRMLEGDENRLMTEIAREMNV